MSVRTSVMPRLFNPLALIEANFRKPTGWFGQILGHMMAVQHRSLTVWVIDLMTITPEDVVLDIGCGGGMAASLLAQRTSAGRVAGIDYSETMVHQARARNHHAVQRGQVEITLGNAMALPYTANTFDKVCGIETLYFWPDPLAGLREVYRVLKPGGVAAIAMEMSKEASAQTSVLQRYFSERYARRSAGLGMSICSGAELVRLFTQAGFTEARYESRPDKSLGWLCGLASK